MSENDIAYQVRGAAFDVHTALGPGLLESVYEAAMAHEIRKRGLQVATQIGLPAYYDTVKLDLGFRLDLLVEDKVIVEIKSVEALADVHHKQLLTYLRLSKRKLGLLINFNLPHVRDGIVRIANNL